MRGLRPKTQRRLWLSTTLPSFIGWGVMAGALVMMLHSWWVPVFMAGLWLWNAGFIAKMVFAIASRTMEGMIERLEER